QTGEESLDHGARLQLHRAQPRDDGRVQEPEIAAWGSGGHLGTPSPHRNGKWEMANGKVPTSRRPMSFLPFTISHSRWVRYKPLRGVGTASSRRSMRLSAE